MKNQYYGDINDYLKYGILRILTNNGFRICVSWMLTDNDNRGDGDKLQYLEQKNKWKSCDPELFDSLNTSVKGNRRNVDEAKKNRIIPSAIYYSKHLTDNLTARHKHFDDLQQQAHASDLIFFDPDNGMEVKSHKNGNKHSCKYLYWDEARRFSKTHSLLIIQFYQRKKRDVFIAERIKEFRTATEASWVKALVTPHVCFFLIPRKSHEDKLNKAYHAVLKKWHPHIQDKNIPQRQRAI